MSFHKACTTLALHQQLSETSWPEGGGIALPSTVVAHKHLHELVRHITQISSRNRLGMLVSPVQPNANG